MVMKQGIVFHRAMFQASKQRSPGRGMKEGRKEAGKVNNQESIVNKGVK